MGVGIPQKCPIPNKIQQFQSITLRKITNAPPFVSNYTLQKDLLIKTVIEETTRFYKNFHIRLKTHSLKTCTPKDTVHRTP